MAQRPRRIAMPATAKAGEIINIRTLIRHPMVTGHGVDPEGRRIPRDIVKELRVRYGGEEVFRAELFPGVSANPMIAFTTVATATGELVFEWTEDNGEVTVETRRLTVT
jgi:sulfur-oxidizing protein SoxZ